MTQSKIYPVPASVAINAHIDVETYQQMHELSVNDPDRFWEARAEEFIDWEQHWETISDCDFSEARINWFDGAKLNVCYNCVDRHLETKADEPAVIWEGDDPRVDKKISYAELYEEVCRFANALKQLGVEKGDRVCIYMPMIAEAMVAMLACARIGAVHTVAPTISTADELTEQVYDADCAVIITADQAFRGGNRIPLKDNVDLTCKDLDSIKRVVVVKVAMNEVEWHEGRDHWYHDVVSNVSDDCPAEPMDANDPLFIVYTPPNSVDKLKGIVHTCGGYLVYCAVTFKYVFDYHDGDVYWCSAGLDNIVGHSYVVYGPLACGARVVMYEGVPTYPQADRFWQIITKHQVNIFYTDSATLDLLKHQNLEAVPELTSLRMLGTGGTKLDTELWEWFYQKIGNSRCPIMNAWWQAETGGILLSPMPGVTDLKPGSVASPFFGISPALVDDQDNELEDAAQGSLVFKQSWPGQMLTVHNDEERFRRDYFKQDTEYYYCRDHARRDEDDCYWIV